MRASKYTAQLLAPLVASSSSMAEVLRKLGLPTTGGNHRQILARIRQAGLDMSHFGSKLRARVYAIPELELRDAVVRGTSLAQVLTLFGLPDQGRAHRELTKRVAALEIDCSSQRGSAWNRGETEHTNPSVAKIARKRRIPNEIVFVEVSPIITSGRNLIKRLLAMGWKYCCSECGISDWLGKRLVLHLDHVNGIHTDNRLVNLRLLCPNCHSQTDTYCNKTRPNRASEPRARYSCYTTVTRAWRNWLTQHV